MDAPAQLNFSTEQVSPVLGMVYGVMSVGPMNVGPMSVGKIGFCGVSFQIIVGIAVGTDVGGAVGGIISGSLSVLPVMVAYCPHSQQFPPPPGVLMTQ